MKCVFGSLSLSLSLSLSHSLFTVFARLFAPFGIFLTAHLRVNDFRSPSRVSFQHKTYNFQLKNIKQFDDCAADSTKK